MASHLDDFTATVEHRPPERILYHAGFVADLERRVVEHIGSDDVAGHYGFDHSVSIGLRRPAGVQPPDYGRYWAEDLPEGTTFNSVGAARVPSGFYHFWGYVSPLRNASSLKEIEDYPLEDYARWDDSGMADAVAEAHAAGRIAVGWIGHMYETAWQIRGYEAFLIDTIDRPAWAACLLERLFQQNLVKARAAACAGVDYIRCGDDVANQNTLMFNKPTWRRLIHDRWAAVWDEVKRINQNVRIWYHSDGNVIDIVGDLVDAGLDILNPLQPECLDIDRVHREFGRHLTLDGTIGTQSTMPFGTPADVKDRVREAIDRYGRAGGLIIAPTHVLEPDVPIENVDAFFDACREYGDLT